MPPLRVWTGKAIFALALFVSQLVFVPGLADSGDGHTSEQRYRDLDSYFASDAWRRARHDQVVFIGIDGAAWQFIKPLVADGKLPSFSRLMREGSFATLRSLECAVSPPAWVSMLSGYLPDKTGVYTFGKYNREDHRFVSITANDVERMRTWDVASYAGRRVAAVNVPITYPVRPVNGIMVSGLMTPIESAELIRPYAATQEHANNIPVNKTIATYSPVLRQAIDDSLNSFRWSVYDTKNDRVRDYDRVSVTVYSKSQEHSASPERGTYTFDVGQFSPWIKIHSTRNGRLADAWWRFKVMATRDGGLRLGSSPVFFPIDEAYTYPPDLDRVLREEFNYYLPTRFLPSAMVPDMTEEAERYANFLYDYDDWDLFHFVFTQSDNIHHLSGFGSTAVRVYQTIDRFLGEMMDRLPPGAKLVVASDHGFGKFDYSIDLNLYLASVGLLEWDDDGSVDFDRTLLFHNLWHLYFNHDLLTEKALRARGVALPRGGDPATALASHLRRLGREFAAADGSPLPLEFERIETGAGVRPDMGVRGSYEGYHVAFWNLKSPGTAIVHRNHGDSEGWFHIRDGIFIAWGQDVRRGNDLGVRDIQDVAPTLLYMMDLPIAQDMDGRIMEDLFAHLYLAANERAIVDEYALITHDSTATRTDEESLEKRLRGLGYIR